MLKNLLGQNPIQGDITISRHIPSVNMIDHSFHDFEPAVSVNKQPPSSLQSCNMVVEMNSSCPLDTSASTASRQEKHWCAEYTLLPMIHLPLCSGLSPLTMTLMASVQQLTQWLSPVKHFAISQTDILVSVRRYWKVTAILITTRPLTTPT